MTKEEMTTKLAQYLREDGAYDIEAIEKAYDTSSVAATFSMMFDEWEGDHETSEADECVDFARAHNRQVAVRKAEAEQEAEDAPLREELVQFLDDKGYYDTDKINKTYFDLILTDKHSHYHAVTKFAFRHNAQLFQTRAKAAAPDVLKKPRAEWTQLDWSILCEVGLAIIEDHGGYQDGYFVLNSDVAQNIDEWSEEELASLGL